MLTLGVGLEVTGAGVGLGVGLKVIGAGVGLGVGMAVTGAGVGLGVGLGVTGAGDGLGVGLGVGFFVGEAVAGCTREKVEDILLVCLIIKRSHILQNYISHDIPELWEGRHMIQKSWSLWFQMFHPQS